MFLTGLCLKEVKFANSTHAVDFVMFTWRWTSGLSNETAKIIPYVIIEHVFYYG